MEVGLNMSIVFLETDLMKIWKITTTDDNNRRTA
jgi:hypothetical protein